MKVGEQYDESDWLQNFATLFALAGILANPETKLRSRESLHYEAQVEELVGVAKDFARAFMGPPLTEEGLEYGDKSGIAAIKPRKKYERKAP